MTATDELRRLLDERGVEWTAPNSCLRDEITSWAAGGFYYDAFEVPEPDGTFLLTATPQDDLTPEQAVEATLGSDLKAENEKLRELVLDYEELAAKLCDSRECDGCPFDTESTMCKHMHMLLRVGELGIGEDA